MRVSLVASVLLLAACSSASPRAHTQPAPATASAAPVTDVALISTTGESCPEPAHFAAALERAPDRTPNDAQVVGWSYSPWCTGSLILYGVHERVDLFLGGLVKLDDGNGQQRVRILELAN